jgi:hypothetical protein
LLESAEAQAGRIETRTGSVCTDIGWAQGLHAWPGLAAIGKMVRTREIQGKTTTQTSYCLLMTPLSAQRFTEVARAQWGIQAGGFQRLAEGEAKASRVERRVPKPLTQPVC